MQRSLQKSGPKTALKVKPGRIFVEGDELCRRQCRSRRVTRVAWHRHGRHLGMVLGKELRRAGGAKTERQHREDKCRRGELVR